MKNFVEINRIPLGATKNTVFVPEGGKFKRLLLSVIFSIVSITPSWAWYSFTKDKVIYFDNHLTKWENVYLRAGKYANDGNYNDAWQITDIVAGTKYLYSFTLPSNYEYKAFYFANNQGWTGANRIDQPWDDNGTNKPNDGWAITGRTTYNEWSLDEMRTFIPTSKGGSYAGADYYNTSVQDNAVDIYTVSYSSSSNGTLSVTKYNGSSYDAFSSGSYVKPTQIMKIIATPNIGYEVSSLTITGATQIDDGNTYYVTANTTISATFSPLYTVSIEKNIDAAGTISNTSVQAGTTTNPTITATPNTNYIFLNWSYDDSKIALNDESSTVSGSSATVTATADATITANFADQWAIAGIAESGTTADFGYFRGLPNTAANTYSKTYTLAEGSYSFKVVDRASNTWYTAASETVDRDHTSKDASTTGGTGNHMTLVVDLAGDYTFTFHTNDNSLTVTYPTYTEALSTMTVETAGSNILGGDGSTSVNAWKIYNSQVDVASLTMTVSPTSSAQGGEIKYAIGSTEKGTVSGGSQTIAASDLSLSTTPTQYTFSAYFKKGSYKSTGTEKSVSYYIQKTSDPVVSFSTEVSSSEVTNAQLTSTITLNASVANNLVDEGSLYTYCVKTPGSEEWEVIASSAGNSTTYTPVAVGTYTFKVKWTHTQEWESDEKSVLIWDNYTIYIWDPDNKAEYVHIWKDAVSKYSWGSSSEAMTDKSDVWGTGWRSFILQYPLYDEIKVHEANDYSGAGNQSETYQFTQEPLLANNNVYFHVTYNSGSNWTLSSIEEPQKPSVTITQINLYPTWLEVDVAIDNNYSLLTTPTITVNNAAPGSAPTGTISSTEGGTYTYKLTGLSENTDYTFHVSATNGLGTTNKNETFTTLAKAPITMTIKVSSNLMANSSGYWGEGGETRVGVHYWSRTDPKAFDDGEITLTDGVLKDGWYWYKCVFEDSPVSFYVYNMKTGYSGTDGNRSAEYYDASGNHCTEVQDAVTCGSGNHCLNQPSICGTHYQLKYFNGAKTYVSNMIGDESEKMSLFIGAYNSGSPASRSLKLYKYTTGWDSGTEIFSTVNPSDSAVYVISLAENSNFESANTAADWVFEKYTGDYYIRTDHAPGGRNNYRGNSNKMHYSDYAAIATGSTFDHYFCKWVQGDSNDKRNVSFTVANDFNDNLLNQGSDNYYVSDNYATGDGYLTQNASVRFMYDSRKNNFSRAYLSGSSDASDRFLILRGNSSNKLYTVNNVGEKGDEFSADGQTDWALLGDNNNWIYQLDVYAKPGTRIKLTARFKDSSGNNRTQSFLGEAVAETVGDDTFTDSNTELLIGGSGETFYQMRVIYDFKTNRLMTAWIPTELGSELAIHADVMLVREGQNDAQQITLNNHDLTDVHTVYAVMQFNRWKLNNRANPNLQTVASCAREVSANNWVYDETVTNTNHPVLDEVDDAGQWLTQYERDLYWISFPFDVNLNEVFGSVGTYGTHWIIERYDGKGRAQNGFWADSPSNWKFITNINTTLNAYEGYILALDLDYFAYNNTTTWANNIHQVELYFPSSSSETSPIKITTNKLDVEFKDQSDYQCHIDRRTDKTTPNTDKDRRVVDSYWHCIGTPSFHNVDTLTTYENPTNPGADGNIPVPTAGTYWKPEGKMFLYKWNKDNTLSVITSGSKQTFKSMWSYMVQYSSSSLTWHSVSQVAPNSVAARVTQMPDREYNLMLMRDSIEEDHTYVRLTDDANATNAFEFNYDLCKEQNSSKGNIWTVTTDVIPVAGNSMPKPVQTTVVPVGVKVVANGEYTLSMPEGTNGEDVYLIDNAYGTRTNLGLMPYTVTLTAGTYDSRFALEFGPIQDSPTSLENDGLSRSDELNDANADVRKVFVGGRLYIIRDGKVYDAAGQRIE